MPSYFPPIDEARAAEDLRARIHDYCLDGYAEVILHLARPSVRFSLEPWEGEPLPERSTYFGGSPDVPIDFQWPSFRSQPLTFIAQIDLSEMIAYAELPLPNAGLLSFFYEAVDQPWGEVGEAGSCAVYWIPPEIPTTRTNAPTHDEIFPPDGQDWEIADVRPCRAIPRVAMTLPSEESPLVAPIVGVGEESFEPLAIAYTSLRRSLGCYADTQLGGYPGELQGPVEIDADFGAFGDQDGERSSKWDSLLTVGDESTALRVMWALSGALYVLNPPGRSAMRDFSRAWAVIQGT
jgi:hypothetical protein